MNEHEKRPKPANFVEPLRGDVLPPVRSVPDVVDPYADAMPQTIQMVTKYEATPITRAQAMVKKVHTVTVALAILTAAAMLMLKHEFVFLTWLVLASAEWIGVFVLLAILDYRETPAAQNRMQTGRYLGLMENEHQHRLRAMYPTQYDERGKRKW